MIRSGDDAMDADSAPSVEKAATAPKGVGAREVIEHLGSLMAEMLIKVR
jgi:hypothetical protein